MKLTAVSAAWMFAAAFYSAAVIAFIPNPPLSPHGLFMANTAHNMAQLLIGALFGRIGGRPFYSLSVGRESIPVARRPAHVAVPRNIIGVHEIPWMSWPP